MSSLEELIGGDALEVNQQVEILRLIEQLRTLRMSRGMDVRELAEALGCSAKDIVRFESDAHLGVVNLDFVADYLSAVRGFLRFDVSKEEDTPATDLVSKFSHDFVRTSTPEPGDVYSARRYSHTFEVRAVTR